ncbi:MAG: hypothetical protein ABMA26_08660, partial [Limisphaerales bacterium]
MNKLRLSLSVMAALMLGACCIPERTIKNSAAVQPTNALASTPMPDELDKLNQLFLRSYKTRRDVVKAGIEPLIVADFDTLTLTWKGVTLTNAVIPELYHSLKSVAHAPIGLYFLLQPVAQPGGGTVSQAVAATLQTYRDQIAGSVAALGRAGFTPVQRARQEEILRRCSALCEQTRSAGKIDAAGLNQFARTIGPALMANAADAAIVQLNATHAVVTKWRQQVPPERWRELTVVVCGPQTPRRLNIFTQYFARVLNEPGHHLGYPLESRHLVYAEYILPGRDHLDV